MRVLGEMSWNTLADVTSAWAACWSWHPIKACKKVGRPRKTGLLGELGSQEKCPRRKRLLRERS
jgi:hypothetical protein